MSRLNDASNTCNWDKLKEINPTNELIKLKFVGGLADEQLKLKLFEKLQTNNKLTTNELIDHCQMLRQLNKFALKDNDFNKDESVKPNETLFIKKRKNCLKCGSQHGYGKCPAFNKTCNNCGGRNHFGKMCKKPKKPVGKKFTNSVNESSSKPLFRSIFVNDKKLRFLT